MTPIELITRMQAELTHGQLHEWPVVRNTEDQTIGVSDFYTDTDRQVVVLTCDE